MNYRHVFHAGNFADVHKHAVLTALLLRLRQRQKPMCYVESHAGAGVYRLDSLQARRSAEFATGIGRLATVAPGNAALAIYLQVVAALPENAVALSAYPGSPLIAAGLLGEADRLVLAERQQDEADALRYLFRHDHRVAVHCRDGWEALGALLPPAPRRGLLLIDPPYEAHDDFRRVVSGMIQARRRWPVGVLAAWYPIKDRRGLHSFYRELAGAGLGSLLRTEFLLRRDDNPAGLNGSGMVVAGPPWGIEAQLGELLAELADLLAQQGAPGPRVDWLAPNGTPAG
jgi:23S rRNA (adenine2030-N6)-methyltransferase